MISNVFTEFVLLIYSASVKKTRCTNSLSKKIVLIQLDTLRLFNSRIDAIMSCFILEVIDTNFAGANMIWCI